MSELLDVARRVAEQAKPRRADRGVRGAVHRVAVRAYQGEVEALTSAESSGIRRARHRRQARRLRPCGHARRGRDHRGAGRRPRQRGVRRGRRLERARRARRRRGSTSSTSIDPSWSSFPTERKVELALELERATLRGDSRITGVRTASYGDGSGEAAIATSTGIAVASRCHVVLADGARPRVARRRGAVGLRHRRRPRAGRARHRGDGGRRGRTSHAHARRKQPKSQRLTVVLDPRVAASFLSIIGGTLTGERVLKGRSPFADRMGDAHRADPDAR